MAVVVFVHTFCICDILWKESFNSDGQHYHQYQQDDSDGQQFHQYQQDDSDGQQFH